MEIEVNYSAEEKKGFRNNLVQDGIFATQELDKRKEEAEKFKDVSDIKAKVN
jgi:preprotein translocase subunit SecB